MLEKSAQVFLNQLPFFAGLKETETRTVLAATAIKIFSKGQSIFECGQPAKLFFIIMNGWIKTHKVTEDGEETICDLLGRGDFAGEAAIFGGSNHAVSAQALAETKVLVIPAEEFRQCMKDSPELMSRVMTVMAKKIQKLQMENEHMTLMNAPERVGCLLLQLSAQMIGKGGVFELPYDKSVAAAKLGMKPETFSRALGQLKPYGIDVHGSEISIRNFQSVAEGICRHCTAGCGECPRARSGDAARPPHRVTA